jgi:hypothetical protein
MKTVLEKINEDVIESVLERIFEMSSDLRNLQENLQDINKNLKDINTSYLSGKISQDMYKDSKNELSKRRKIAIDNVNKMVNDILTVSKSLPGILNKSKI